MKGSKLICILLAIIVVAFAFKSCVFKEDDKKNKEAIEKPQKQEQELAKDLIKSSTTFFIGSWELDYKDMVHYTFTEAGEPQIDLNKQPKQYTFNRVREALILEEEYPIVDQEYKDKQFSLKIDLKIMNLVIIGELKDNNSWVGTFEYTSEDGKILSKCNVSAKRVH